MKKFLPYMGAAIATLAMTWSVQASAQDMFKDVPSDHWAYSAISDLQAKKILLGYPNGYFQGKRVLTRYEFAVALKRALDAIPAGKDGKPGADGAAGAAGKDGENGKDGAQGAPGMTPEEVTALQKLADTFKAELASLGTNVKAINARLDTLSKQVTALGEKIDKLPMIHGEFFTGFRSDLASAPFVDQAGVARHASKSPFTGIDNPTDFHLQVGANLAGGVKFVGDLVESNYLNYAPLNSQAVARPAMGNGGAFQTNVYTAEIIVPVSQFGSKTTLELGRFKNSLSDLVYMRPDTDPYFSLPWYDDGKYVQDGFKLTTKLGSVSTQLFAGSYTNLTSSNGVALNTVNLAAGTASQSVGLDLKLPVSKIGEVGFTLLDLSGSSAQAVVNGSNINEVVYGASLKLNQMGKIGISGEFAKSVVQSSITNGANVSNDDNNAYKINAAFKSGAVGINAGYLYIDPNFSAPGSWLQVGSYYNPTNLQGPYAGLDYKFSGKLTGSATGAFLEGARNRPGSFTQGSSIGKVTTGLKYHLSKVVHLSAAYEGDFWNVSAGAVGAHATAWQQYITLGAGLNLAGNTTLKFGYQILANQDKSGVTALTGQALGATQNANVFTTQVSVHF